MHKVLIANRSEIALRVIRACKEMGLATVAVYSKADENALHVHMADEAICIGPARASDSYLKIGNILSAAEITGADAIHPGYGFLSESAHFARICHQCGLQFIGPGADGIALLGDKSRARTIAAAAKVPIIPGSRGELSSVDEAKTLAQQYGYPVMLKASSGGGGKGIRVVTSDAEMTSAYEQASHEAHQAFGSGALYLEKMIINPRHVEVQIASDRHGNTVHFFERDCSVQRRRQKLIEEATSPILSSELRESICGAAVKLISSTPYHSLATVEFLVDQAGQFYFMEVNTRVQVEHCVTEELTGFDLIKEQIRIAFGEQLSMRQHEITARGHVMELRINAENPAKGFSPSPGKIEHYITPGGPHIRLDTACYRGYEIPPYYDSMIAKLIIRGRDRHETIRVARRALEEFHITGIATTLPFHRYMMEDAAFIAGHYDLTYIDRLTAQGRKFIRE